MGGVVGPPLDIGISPEYDLSYAHAMGWVTHLLSSKKLKAMASPPCTTFSIMRRPRLRSALFPFGFDTKDQQTVTGNLLGQRGAQLLYAAAANRASGILGTTYSSYLKYLPGWRLKCAEETRCDSCVVGSPHLKPFRFLGVHADLRRFRARCRCKCYM